MKSNLSDRNTLPGQTVETEPVTREDVQARARQLALIDGRSPLDVSQAEYEQAKRELTGESDLDRQAAVLDAISGKKRAAPKPDSTERQVPDQINDDEGEEGRSQSEQRVKKGGEQAEHDQMLQAAIEASKSRR